MVMHYQTEGLSLAWVACLGRKRRAEKEARVASRAREEVVLSRLREWPAGERTALVARLSL